MTENVLNGVSWAIRLSLLIAAGGALIEARWLVLFVSLGTLVLSFLPLFIEKNHRINFPVEFELAIVLFLYATLFLGEVHGYYTRFWWWDMVLHAGSAIALGIAGFLILYILLLERKVHASPFLTAVFSFCFAVAIGAVWEIFEFGMDQLFGFNMQKSGLVDTMWDLIVDCGGAAIASVSGYLYLKTGEKRIIGNLIEKFLIENPDNS